MMPDRITKQRLEELRQAVTEQDRVILTSLLGCRYLTGQQIVRLYFNEKADNQTAAFSAAYRCLNRLKDYGLIRALQRRIGGVRAGSGSYVWVLTSAGFRLLNLNRTDGTSRKQFREPTPHFLEHTLIISEAWLQLTEICNRSGMTLSKVQFEPDCWRWYAAGGKQAVLKPDLYAVIQADGYEDCWFIEIDCDTETVARVMDKCERYIHYLHSGAEQKQAGVFPYVAWIVPDEKRKSSIKKHIHMHYPRGPNIFIVILPDELEGLVVGGAAEYLEKPIDDS